MNLEARAENSSVAAREVDLGPKASAFVRYAGWDTLARKEGIMELIEDPTFLSLFAQVQVMDAVLMASLKSHPRPAELLEHIEQNIARSLGERATGCGRSDWQAVGREDGTPGGRLAKLRSQRSDRGLKAFAGCRFLEGSSRNVVGALFSASCQFSARIQF